MKFIPVYDFQIQIYFSDSFIFYVPRWFNWSETVRSLIPNFCASSQTIIHVQLTP